MLTYKARMPNAAFIIVLPQPDAAAVFTNDADKTSASVKTVKRSSHCHLPVIPPTFGAPP
jgi:hypothetical protein